MEFKVALKVEVVGETGPFFDVFDVVKEFLGGFEEVPFFDVAVGGEGAESLGKDHVAGFHVVAGVAELVHHAGGKWGPFGIGVDGDDGVDFANIPVEVAMDGVGVDGFAVGRGFVVVVGADFDGLRVDDYGELAELVDDFVDLNSFVRGGVGHGVTGVNNPRIGMHGEFVEGFGRFSNGHDVMGDAHVAGPVFRETDFFVHPREDFVEVMVSFAKGVEEGVGFGGIFQFFFNEPFGIDEGDDDVGPDEVANDALVFEFAVDSVPLASGGSADDDIGVAVSLDFVTDFFVFAFAGEFEEVVGGAEEPFERFFAAFGELFNGVEDFDLPTVALAESDDPLKVGVVIHAGQHPRYQYAHCENLPVHGGLSAP